MARTDKRIDAYLAVDTERDYQDERFKDKPELSIAESISVLGKLNADALLAWYADDATEALAHMRKIAAVAVRCMELYGSPLRS